MKRYLGVCPGICPALLSLLSLWLVLHPLGLRASPPVEIVPIKLADYRFAPDEIRMRVGDTVQLELSNADGLTPHDFTLQAKDAGLEVDVDVGAGKTHVLELTPRAPGTYSFFCNKKLPFMKSHTERGMEGTLIVVPASPE